MRRSVIIFKNSFYPVVKSKLYKVILFIFLFLTIGTLIPVGIEFGKIPEKFPAEMITGENNEIFMNIFRQVTGQVTASISFFITMLPYVTLMWVLGLISEEKRSTGIIESQLATPLRPAELWLGNSFSLIVSALIISIPSLIICISGLTVISSYILKQFFFCFPLPVALSTLLFNQLFFSYMMTLTVLFSFTLSEEAAMLPSFITGFGVMVLFPAGLITGTINPAGWSFVLITGLMTSGIGLLMLPFLKFFKKENLILFMKRE